MSNVKETARSVMNELSGLAVVLDGLQVCQEVPPMDWLQSWVNRLHNELDAALIADFQKGEQS
ncbi:hypothetical protein AA14337_0325 [Acetobacter malorum DSM 14337]|uniref:Transposase n=1 Tax=Acetobacter malorum DSM 14337 TaxID=1307910 RepID=A0ABQ0PMA3_9PROT|nr:hypothetical protein [Acetobacter malorum]KXV07011.1 hypothetical protein AD930_05635 [Acetobacter malorum]GBQ75784.1 hypothetical protein AA14337_0325 [Acetobacter malorum DSM 14337]